MRAEHVCQTMQPLAPDGLPGKIESWLNPGDLIDLVQRAVMHGTLQMKCVGRTLHVAPHTLSPHR